MRARCLVVSAVLAGLVLGACGSSGRELREPAPGATAPPRRQSSAGSVGSSTTLGTVFAITTDAWAPGTAIPARYTCEGENVSPPLVISSIPPGTVELVVTVTDPDAGGFVHWILAALPPSTTAIEEGSVPNGSVEAAGTGGFVGWFGPCPPPGPSHTYDVTVHALAAPSGVEPGQPAADALALVEGAPQVTPPGVMTGTFER